MTCIEKSEITIQKAQKSNKQLKKMDRLKMLRKRECVYTENGSDSRER